MGNDHDQSWESTSAGAQVEDLLLHIRRATDIESQHLEAQRVELQKQHAERIKELQDEVGMGQKSSRMVKIY